MVELIGIIRYMKKYLLTEKEMVILRYNLVKKGNYCRRTIDNLQDIIIFLTFVCFHKYWKLYENI